MLDRSLENHHRRPHVPQDHGSVGGGQADPRHAALHRQAMHSQRQGVRPKNWPGPWPMHTAPLVQRSHSPRRRQRAPRQRHHYENRPARDERHRNELLQLGNHVQRRSSFAGSGPRKPHQAGPRAPVALLPRPGARGHDALRPHGVRRQRRQHRHRNHLHRPTLHNPRKRIPAAAPLRLLRAGRRQALRPQPQPDLNRRRPVHQLPLRYCQSQPSCPQHASHRSSHCSHWPPPCALCTALCSAQFVTVPHAVC